MPEISSHYTLHDITNGIPNFLGNVHVQSQQGEFYWCYPTQQNLDEGNFNFQKSVGGHITFKVSEIGTGVVVLKSDSPVSVRIWSDILPQEIVSKTSPTGNMSIVIWIALLAIVIIMISKKK